MYKEPKKLHFETSIKTSPIIAHHAINNGFRPVNRGPIVAVEAVRTGQELQNN